ncbi:unnamed protein product, partial [Prunus brigantina]
MSKAPLLSKPLPGEILFLYLSVSSTAISSILIRKPENAELPIFYVSKVLHSAELRYPPLEQLALALVISARRLRPYFQAHEITVLTNQPLRQPSVKHFNPSIHVWILHVDSLANQQGCGAGLVLTKPDGVKIEYALRFNFRTSNNEAEYEAFLAGLRLAKSMNAK